MAQTTAAVIAKLRGLTAKFDSGVKATTPFYPRLAMTIPSMGADEDYGMLGAVPAVREWLGDRQFKDPLAVDFIIKNRHWELSERIRKTDIDDDRLGLYSPRLEEMGKRAARHPDKLLFSDLIANAESTACLDGQNYFDTDHSWGDSGTQDNDLTYNVTTPASPTVAEFKLAFNQALTAMLGFVDDKGELLHDDAIVGDGGIDLVLVVPMGFWQVAKEAMTATLIGSGNTNVVLNQADVIPSPRYTGTKFDLYRTDPAFKPFIFQARQPLRRQMKGDNDIEFKDVKFMTEARYNMGYGAWWNAVRTTLT